MNFHDRTGVLLQIEHIPESSDGDLKCHVFCFEDTFPRIKKLTIEKYTYK